MAKPKDTATFAVELQPEGFKAGAESVAQAGERLQKTLDEDTAALSAMQRALRNLKGGGAVAQAQVDKMKTAIAAQKARIASTQESLLKLGLGFKRTGQDAKGFGRALDVLKAQGRAGPLGAIVAQLGGLRALLAAGAGAAGLLAIAAAFLAITAAAGYAAVSVSKYALATADAYRSERLQLEGLVRVRNWYGLAADKASFLQQQIDRVSASSALGRDRIAGLAEELYSLNLRGGNLQQALEGASIALATQGERGLAQFKAMAFGAAMFGGSVKKVTEDFKARLGPIARAQMLSLDVQVRKTRESIAALFQGLRIEPVLEALHMVTELFSQNTETGRGLKRLVSSIFNPLAGTIAAVGPLAKRFFQGMVLGAIELAIAFYTVRNWFVKTFGGNEALASMRRQAQAFELGKMAVIAFGLVVAGVVAAAVVSFGLLALAVAVALFPLYALYRAIKFGVSVFGALKKAIKDAFAGNWSGIGSTIWQGIVKGLLGGKSQVANAAGQLGEAAKTGATESLDSHSPSRAMAKIGVTAPQGLAVGETRGLPLVKRASARLGETALVSFKASLGDFEAPPPNFETPAQPTQPDARRRASTPALAPLRLEALPALPTPRAPQQQQQARGRDVPLIGELNQYFSDAEPNERTRRMRDEMLRTLQDVLTSLGGPEVKPA